METLRREELLLLDDDDDDDAANDDDCRSARANIVVVKAGCILFGFVRVNYIYITGGITRARWKDVFCCEEMK